MYNINMGSGLINMPEIIFDGIRSNCAEFVEYNGGSPCRYCRNEDGDKNVCSKECEARLKYQATGKWDFRDIPTDIKGILTKKEALSSRRKKGGGKKKYSDETAIKLGYKSLGAAVVALSDSGKEMDEIAKILGISYRHVSGIYREEVGMTIRQRIIKRAAIRKEECQKLYAEGVRITQISLKVGLAESTTREYIRCPELNELKKKRCQALSKAGLSIKQISKKMIISAETVSSYISG
jgi:DNA-binding CsgD family transcriptional regulator